MSFLDSLMYSRAMRNPGFAQQENQRLADERERRYLMEDIAANQALYDQAYGQGGLMHGFDQMTPEQQIAARTQFGNLAGLTSPLQDTRTTYGSQFGQLSEPPKVSDFQRRQQWFLDNPQEFSRYMAAMNQGKGTNIDLDLGSRLREVDEEARLDDLRAVHDAARTRVGAAVDQAIAARQDTQDIDQTLALLERVETGSLEELRTAAMQLGRTFGFSIDEEDLANREALQTRLGNEVMARVAETKGAVSEKEMDLFTRYSANFGKTQRGNMLVLEARKQKRDRDVEIGKLIRRMRDAGATSRAIDRAIQDHVADNPITDESVRASVDRRMRRVQIPEGADVTPGLFD